MLTRLEVNKNQTLVDRDKLRNLEFGLWTLDFFLKTFL